MTVKLLIYSRAKYFAFLTSFEKKNINHQKQIEFGSESIMQNLLKVEFFID